MSTYNYSYNVLINRLEAFAAGHFLIKRFTHGQIDLADQMQDDQYPFMHVTPDTIKPVQGGMQFGFHIIFADIPRDKELKAEYQREVISDCVRLGQDLIAEVRNGLELFGFNVQLVNNPTFEPFMEEYKNTLTGVAFTIELEVPWDWSACNIPAIWAVGGDSTGGTGTPYSLLLQTNNVDNASQSLLNLVNGSNITIVDNGDGSVTINASGLSQVNADWNAVSGAAEILNKPTLASVATSGDYNDLTNLPTIPAAQVNSDWNAVSGVAEILNKPSIPAAQVNSDWSAVSGVAQILNKPTIPALLDDLTDVNTAGESLGKVLYYNGSIWVPYALAAVAYSGSYNDLSNTPSIPKTLSDLIKGTANKQLIQYNGTSWVTISGLNLGDLLNVNGVPTNGQVLTYDSATSKWIPTTPTSGSGTVTSVALTAPAAFSVSGSPVTTSGTIAITGAGTSAQYVDGTGALQTLPTGLPPTGAAGGDLSGTYPNPNVDRVHGIDFQSGTPTANDVWVYGGSPAKWQHQHVNSNIVDNNSGVTGATISDALNTLDSGKVASNAAITAGTATKITYDAKGLVTAGATLVASDMPTGIDAAKINTGTVSNTEFGYLDGVTSAIQTQIDSKISSARTISTTSPLSGGGDLSANRTLSIADAAADGTTKGAATFTAADFNATSGVISLDYTNGQKASASQPGFLSAADWSTFNSKATRDTFVIRMQLLNVSPADATTYYLSNSSIGLSTSATGYKFAFPYACKLVGASIVSQNNTTAASNEASTLYFRLNNTTDVLLTNAATMGGATVVVNTYTVTGLTTSIAAGDTANIKWVTPTWVTNPTGACIVIELYFERT